MRCDMEKRFFEEKKVDDFFVDEAKNCKENYRELMNGYKSIIFVNFFVVL